MVRSSSEEAALNDTFYHQLPNARSLDEDLEMLRTQPHSLDKVHPFFCLKYVSKNQAIPQNLRALRASEQYETLKNELIDAVKSDNWDEQPILSHRYMREKFPDHEVAPLIENLALLVRQEGGNLSEAEWQTLFTWLNLKEQFGGEKLSLYRTAYPVREKDMDAIKNSPQAQETIQELVDAVHSGNWEDAVFDSPFIILEDEQTILPIKDLALYAKRENLISPAAFRLLFAWADAKQTYLSMEQAGDTPVLYSTADQERLEKLAPVMAEPRMKDIARQLLEAVHSGNWESDIFKRTYMREQFPDTADLPTMKEIALAQHQAGNLSDAAYQVTMLWLNLREQYGNKMTAHDNKPARGKETVWMQLPSATGTVKAHRLFDENNELTEKGRKYLDEIASGFDSNSDYFFGYRFDKEAFLERLRSLPRNLQTFFEVDGLDGKEIEKNRHLKFWFEQFGNFQTTPLLAGKYTSDSPKQDWSELEALPIPSAGVEREFHLQFWAGKQRADVLALSPEKKAVESQRFYGRISSATRDELTMNGIHPVLCYHPDIGDNFLEPHNLKAGAAFAPLHDTAFHTLHASMLPPSTRTAMTKVLPAFIRNMVKESNEIEKAVAQELIEQLGDLDFVQDLHDEDFVEKVLSLYCVDLLNRLTDEHPFVVKDDEVHETTDQVDYSKFF